MKSLPVFLSTLILMCACSTDPQETPDDGDVAMYSLSGSVIDFQTQQVIDGQAAVATDGIFPAPIVGVRGAEFEITEIPPASVFHILGAAPGYHNTYSRAFELIDTDIDQGDVRVIGETYLASLAQAYDVDVAAGGVLIAQVVDDNGAPVSGVAADAFELNSAVDFVGPFFLTELLGPDPLLEATSASGYAVFFAVQPGLVTINARSGSGYSMSMTPSPATRTTVTLATVRAVPGGDPVTPTDVSFKDDVLPIFESRGCAACHSKKEIGAEVGGLSLDMRDKRKLHKEVVEEISDKHGVARVDLQQPEQSLLLTEPSPEDPPDSHPNITFRGPTDPDYQMILAWIREGAQNN